MVTIRRLFLFAIIILTSSYCVSQNKLRYDQFTSYFKEVQLPINNFALLKPDRYLEINKKKIDKDLVVEFVYKGDQSKIKYTYDKIDYFEGKIVAKETKEYSFSPVYKITRAQLTLVVFFRSGVNEMKYFLALFNNKNHDLTDLLLVCETHDDSEITELLASKIDEKLMLTTAYYNTNPEIKGKVYHKNDTVNSPKTIIEIKDYDISDIGKFVKRRISSRKSSCFVNDFFDGSKKCIYENPLAE